MLISTLGSGIFPALMQHVNFCAKYWIRMSRFVWKSHLSSRPHQYLSYWNFVKKKIYIWWVYALILFLYGLLRHEIFHLILGVRWEWKVFVRLYSILTRSSAEFPMLEHRFPVHRIFDLIGKFEAVSFRRLCLSIRTKEKLPRAWFAKLVIWRPLCNHRMMRNASI